MKKTLAKIAILIYLGLSLVPFSSFASGTTDPGSNSDAGNYQPLSPIVVPGVPGGPATQIDTNSLPQYLKAIYKIGIGICFVLGVVMFIWAGMEYILTESVASKSDAKGRVQAALTGLAIALISYLLLYTINPDLLKLEDLKPTAQPTASTPAPTPTTH
jgi:hypothetical protein